MRKSGDITLAKRTSRTLSDIVAQKRPYRGWLDLPFVPSDHAM
jgi:hypothetical protein